MTQLRIAIVGFGTVGQGLGRILAARGGAGLKVVAVMDSMSSAIDGGGLDMRKLLSRKQRSGTVGQGSMGLLEALRAVDADAVVELTPGTRDGEPALSHFRAALAASKSVVTANKMPLALRYDELLRSAKKRGVQLLYTACVGGGLPVLEFGRTCAAGEPVESIEGVLNATTNFVLSEMEKGKSYDSALERAQELGYAEPDPSFDVDGLDAACKAVILANHVMGRRFRLRDVKPLRGISGVTLGRVRRAKAAGKAVRLVARAGKSVSVGPAEVGAHSPLAATGRSHAVVFHCRYSGDRTIMGSGAGSVTTSLGVLRDLLSLKDSMGA